MWKHLVTHAQCAVRAPRDHDAHLRMEPMLQFLFFHSFSEVPLGGGGFIFYFLHLCKSITCHNFSLNDSEEKGSIDVVQLYIYRSATVTLQLYLEALRPSCFICFGRGSGT